MRGRKPQARNVCLALRRRQMAERIQRRRGFEGGYQLCNEITFRPSRGYAGSSRSNAARRAAEKCPDLRMPREAG